MGIAHLIIVGHVGRTPELSHLDDGTALLKFSVATGDRKGKTLWWRVTAWRRVAETTAEYIRKGSQVQVIGDVSLREWTGKDGEPRSEPEVTSFSVLVFRGADAAGSTRMGDRDAGDAGTRGGARKSNSGDPGAEDDGMMPF